MEENINKFKSQIFSDNNDRGDTEVHKVVKGATTQLQVPWCNYYPLSPCMCGFSVSSH